MKKIDPVMIGIGIVTIIIIGGIFIASFKAGGQPIAQYQITDTDRPILKTFLNSFDFGQMDLKDIKTKEIELKNTGNQPLIVSDLITSCDCTFAQLVSNSQASPLFSMSRDAKWRGEIAAGEIALLKITYEPRLMPVQGRVSRTVIFKTNDPANPNVNINFTAQVR